MSTAHASIRFQPVAAAFFRWLFSRCEELTATEVMKKKEAIVGGRLIQAGFCCVFILSFSASDAVQDLASISWFYPLLSSRLKSWYHCTPLQRPEYSGEADHRVQLDGSILGLHHGVGVRPPRLRNGWNESFLSLGLPLWLQDVQGVSTARAPWASRYAQLLSWLLNG